MTGIALPLFITASPLHDAGSSPKIGKTPGSLRALKQLLILGKKRLIRRGRGANSSKVAVIGSSYMYLAGR